MLSKERIKFKQFDEELSNNIKYIYGSEFSTVVNNEDSNLSMQNVISFEQDMVMLNWMMDHFLEENMFDNNSIIVRFIHKIKKYGFHISHCIQALLHKKGNYQEALELLFCKYYRTEDVARNVNLPNTMRYDKSAEVEELKLTYGDAFSEKKENYLWTMRLELNYLNDDKNIKQMQEQQNARDKRYKVLQKLQKDCTQTVDPFYTLEIRFPEGCKYPYETPYFYFYKNDRTLPDIICLRIVRRLYNEALILSFHSIPSISSVISLLLNKCNIISNYLANNTEEFLDMSVSLFQKEHDYQREENLQIKESMHATNRKSLEKIDRKNKPYFGKPSVADNDLLRKLLNEKQYDSRYVNMLHCRVSLPAMSCQTKILEAIQQNQVVIISGGTGCGKSTQVPQFILDEWIVKFLGYNSCLNLICTQPRKISAVGLAERVAAERVEYVGDIVGYHIRLERRMSPKTRVLFCTLGILLQILITSKELSNVTHVIIDEVHERSVDSDFLLMLLKDLISRNRTLKIILMSATIKSNTFSSYFNDAPVIHIPRLTFPVKQIFLEELFERTQFTFDKKSKFINKYKYDEVDELLKLLPEKDIIATTVSLDAKDKMAPDHILSLEKLVRRYSNYSTLTHKNLYVMDLEKLNYDLIEKTLEWIVYGNHNYRREGSILIFLPGINEICTMMKQLHKNKHFSNPQWCIIPLHSSLTTEEQNRVFMNYPYKIILSTNLAETSITIEDCSYVIDSGLQKETHFNPVKDMESLEICWISRMNVAQRKGRAGRVKSGVCIHLYTSHSYTLFQEEPTPEILRVPLDQLVLRIYLMHNGTPTDLHGIFAKLIDSPTTMNITTAVQRLQNIGALDSRFVLTPLGHHLAKLPVNVRIGKLILFGTIFCCLDSALTIAAILSDRNPFSVPLDQRGEIPNPKRKFRVNCSDHLTLLNAYNTWLKKCAESASSASDFAVKNYLSKSILYRLAELKYQFLGHLVSSGFVTGISLPARQRGIDNILRITGFKFNVNNKNDKLLRGLLCAALYPNIATVFQKSNNIPIFLTQQHGSVHIHPSSVNYDETSYASPYVVYHEKMRTSKVFISEVTMISVLSLILFSGDELSMTHDGHQHLLSVNSGWLHVPIESQSLGLILQRLRKELIKLLEQKMEDPSLDILNHQQGRRIIDIIVQLLTRE